jgi:hypothetical protein
VKRIIIAAALLLVAAAVAGVARPEGAEAVDGTPATQDSVTVSGSASVSAIPNRAQLSLGVDSRADTARGALSANAKEMRRVIDAVRAAGGRDISTQSVSLSPQLGENGAVTGYAAGNVVVATVDLGRAGAVIDAAVEAGANQVYGPVMSSSDQAKLYGQALEGAVSDARERAEILATAAGRSLGKVTTIVESGGYQPVPMAQKVAFADSGTPVVAGAQETTASVSMTFELR